MIVHPELKIKSHLLLADDLKAYVNYQLGMNDVVLEISNRTRMPR